MAGLDDIGRGVVSTAPKSSWASRLATVLLALALLALGIWAACETPQKAFGIELPERPEVRELSREVLPLAETFVWRRDDAIQAMHNELNKWGECPRVIVFQVLRDKAVEFTVRCVVEWDNTV